MTIQALLKSELINQRTDLIGIARKGIQTKYIEQIQKLTSLTDKELSSILPISQRQLFRYPADHHLNKEITSHLIQIVELFEKGFNLFGEEKFKIWIRTSNKVLNKNKPIEIMDTSIGIEMIKDVIGRIEHGVYS
jgi:putative toxin-antitoxin system antitoxin component (TIGR02293 family)